MLCLRSGYYDILKHHSYAEHTYTMDTQLEIGIKLLRPDTRIEYLSPGTRSIGSKRGGSGKGDVIIEKEKLDECPDTEQMLNALQKRISRSEYFKSSKSTASLCILMLASRGYCIKSSTLEQIENNFIERCWECLNTIADNVSDPLRGWLEKSISNRSSYIFAQIYCTSASIDDNIRYMPPILATKECFKEFHGSISEFPCMFDDRDDPVLHTILSHISSR